MTPTPEDSEWKGKYYTLCREIKLHDLVSRVRMKSFIEETLKAERTRTEKDRDYYEQEKYAEGYTDGRRDAEEMRDLDTE